MNPSNKQFKNNPQNYNILQIMLKEQVMTVVGVQGRVCDTCRAASARVYCTADAAYLCVACDARVHARLASRHERVWVCEACERAPAAFLCKADAASLCASCDADIHAANPLASRHHRVPIMPIPGCLASMAADTDDEEDEAASWLLLNPGKTSNNNNNNNGFLFGGEVVDEYLDLVEYNSCTDQNQFNNDQYSQQQQQQQQQQQYCVPQKNYGSVGGDSVVPVQQQQKQQQQQEQQQSFHSGIEYKSVKDYSYSGSFNRNVSVSSMDVIVPEPAMSDISISHPRPPKGTIDLFSGPPIQMPTQLTPMDREARVLRYREKKKNRKFEKTIRYASRKAYAETRPRIKGRFAKRKEAEVDVDHMFSAQMMGEGGYGIVPSF